MNALTTSDLATILVEEQVVRADALERARRDAETGGKPLWAVLLEAGHCTEEALFRALQARTALPVLPSGRMAVLRLPGELRSLMPQELCAFFGVVPVERIGQQLVLAMVDPLLEVPLLTGLCGRAGLSITRWLVRAGTLRRYLPEIYRPEVQPPPEPGREVSALSDQPTGMVTLPESLRVSPRRPERGDERTALLPGRSSAGRPTVRPGAVESRAAARPMAITQPLAPILADSTRSQPPPQQPPPIPEARPRAPASAASSVQIDPGLEAEIALLGPPTLPSMPAVPLAPPPPPSPKVSSVFHEAQTQTALAKARPAALADRLLQTPTLVPGVNLASGPFLSGAVAAVPGEEAGHLARVLLRAVPTLTRALEDRLLRPGVPGAVELARLVERVAEGEGLPRTAAAELGLLALLYGTLRLLLEDEGQQPPALALELGWEGEQEFGLGACLRELQGDLAAREAGGGPRILAEGQRIVQASLIALDLIQAGATPEGLPALLRRRALEPQEPGQPEGPGERIAMVVAAVLRAEFVDAASGRWSRHLRPPRTAVARPGSSAAGAPGEAERTDPDRSGELLAREPPVKNSSVSMGSGAQPGVEHPTKPETP